MLSKSQTLYILAILAVIAASAAMTAAVDLSAYAVSPFITGLTVVLLCVPAFLAARRWLGAKHAVMIFAGLGVLGLAIETIALQTGFPYGRFDYSAAAGLQLPGGSPWTVAFGWTPLVLGAYAVAAQIARSALGRIAFGVGILLAFDLVLDPGAVAVGLWSYRDSGVFYGVPLQNFVGWIVTGSIALTLLEAYISRLRPLLPVPVQLASSAFLIVSFWTVVAAVESMAVPALLGLAVLGGLAYVCRRYFYAFDEMIVMVDSSNQPVATAKKLDAHTDSTELHRAFSVFLFNDSGELLLQRRSPLKKTWPGVWSNSCCGHTMLHEPVEDAARRRIRYELGISDVRLVNLVPNFSYRAEKDGVVENEICPILLGFTKQEPNPNPDEVSEVRWTTWPGFVEELQVRRDQYSPWAGLETMKLEESPTFYFYLRSMTSISAHDGSDLGSHARFEFQAD
jgi:isopentenyl-diphosphate delta-isomerase type 1